MRVDHATRGSTTGYLWFWTFWHWSRESHRSGAILRDPIEGIGSHWDEWFHHEATEQERRAVETCGETATAQRHFATWLVRCWSREANGARSRPPIRFVLGQLAQVAPFDGWRVLRRYRTGYGAPGISAIVLSEESRGEAADVREIDAITLPIDADAGAPSIVPEGFRADAGDLQTARRAAASVLRGAGLLAFLARWIAAGRRPYPRWLAAVLLAGWLGAAGLIVYLVIGPEPEERLIPLAATLAGVWAALALIGLTMAAWVAVGAWRQGCGWTARLAHAQVRLRMNGGLTLRGASAGLPFALNVLLSLYRARPHAASTAWLWHRVFRTVAADPDAWAATGAVTPDGRVEPVLLEQKLRASLNHPRLRHVLAPRQQEAEARAVARLATPSHAVAVDRVGAMPVPSGERVGLARSRGVSACISAAASRSR
jgi:hypothetical protein